MIIDNKRDRDPNDGINTTTVWDYMKYYTDPEKGPGQTLLSRQ